MKDMLECWDKTKCWDKKCWDERYAGMLGLKKGI
jgi:hypothetical protein